MAITCKGSINRQILIENGNKTARQTFIFYRSREDSLTNLMDHAAFPAEGDAFSEDSDLLCRTIRILPDRSGGKVEVECLYEENEAYSIDFSTDSNISKQRAFNVSFRTIENTIPFEYAYQDSDQHYVPTKPVQSSGGTPFQEKTVHISLLLSFSYYLKKFDPGKILEYCDTVNNANIKICGITIPKGTALIRKMNSSLCRIKKEDVVRLDVEMELDPAGFDRKIPDKGITILDSNGQPSRIYSSIHNSTGKQIYGLWYNIWSLHNPYSPIVSVDHPLPLNGQGALSPGSNGALGTPATLTFHEKYSANWSTLKFPSKGKW